MMPAGAAYPDAAGGQPPRGGGPRPWGNEPCRAPASRPGSGGRRHRRGIGGRTRRGCEDSRLIFCRPCLNTTRSGILRQPDKHKLAICIFLQKKIFSLDVFAGLFVLLSVDPWESRFAPPSQANTVFS